MAYATMIPTSGTTATDGTTHGMIPGTAGMLLTIATATTAGTTGAGAGTTTDGTLLTTMEATTEAIILITMAGTPLVIRQLQAATWDSVQPLIAAELAAAGQATDA